MIILEYGYKPIILKHVFEEVGLEGWNLWNPNPDNPGEMITSGSFYCSDYVAGEVFELPINEDYFYYDRSEFSPDEPIQIEGPSKTDYQVGTTGNIIQWNISITVVADYSCYRNGTLVQEGILDSNETISIDIMVSHPVHIIIFLELKQMSIVHQKM